MADVDFSAWDGPAAMSAAAKSSDPAAALNAICAGKKAGDPKTEAAHALPYRKTPSSPPNAAGVRNALARLSQTEGLTNEAEAKSLLEGHMKTIEAAEAKKSASFPNVRALRAAAYVEGVIPGGGPRATTFPTELRGQMMQWNGRTAYHVTGYATVFNRPYAMYDAFGEYKETADSTMLDRSLATGPDVAFLVNHRGLTMARTITRSGTPSLILAKDTTGLHIEAYLNPQRSDVHDLMMGIDDDVITEMSFAFMLNRGEWDEDFENFRILEADINRGDVSAVNYGANPYTSIEARAADMLRDLDRAPAGIARAAFARVQARLAALDDDDLDGLADWPVVDETGEEPEPEHVEGEHEEPESEERSGKSLNMWRHLLEHA